jgi:acetyl/propionyl-CoA carboxylase alpha subunit
VGADAVHPGYGFLAENADFAARCADAGLAFIGPPVEAIRRMGSKVEARAIMARAGVPVVPGASGAGLDDAALAREAKRIGLPVLIKASAGGGGKGMRLVREAGALPEALAAARREAARAFGDDTLLIERYFDAPRHVELQIFGDTRGRVVHLFERECSIQRRFQKIIEEAPSVAVDDALRARLGAAAVAAGRAIGYTGAGPVEFLLDRDGQFYFLEVNTRLQVEHPVTEAITGLDLVEWQIRVARGEALPFEQGDVARAGHALEARLYAEDPQADFLPASGRIALWEPTPLPGVRYDSGVEAGTEVTVHYDPLLAKIVAHGATRDEARQRLLDALRRLGVAGVTTNREFLLAVLDHPAFAAGEIDTHFIERHLPAAARPGARCGGGPGARARRGDRRTRAPAARRRAAAGQHSVGLAQQPLAPAGCDVSHRRRRDRGALRGQPGRPLRGRDGGQRQPGRGAGGGRGRDRPRGRCAAPALQGRRAWRQGIPARPAGQRRAHRGAALRAALERRYGRRVPGADAGDRPPGPRRGRRLR